MNSKYELLPEHNHNRLPYQKYKYHLPPQRSPKANRQDFSRTHQRQSSAFTFDPSTIKSKQRQRSEHWQQNTTQTIARELIEQNIVLKQMLAQSQNRVKQLQNMLIAFEQQMKELCRQKSRKKQKSGLDQFREQVLLMMDHNKIIEEELRNLKENIPFFLQTGISQGIKQNQFERCRSTSLDSKKMSRINRQNINKQNIEQKKGEELLTSIKGMYLKIMNFPAQSLKELWRWLKAMGSTYSNVRKWSIKVRTILSSGNMSSQKISQLLSEILSMIG